MSSVYPSLLNAFSCTPYNKETITIAAAVVSSPNAIQAARGTFIVEITDVTAASTLRLEVTGGVTRTVNAPASFYIADGSSPFTNNVTITNAGGRAQPILFTNTGTTTTWSLDYNVNTAQGTLQRTGGAAIAGNTTVNVIYLNYFRG